MGGAADVGDIYPNTRDAVEITRESFAMSTDIGAHAPVLEMAYEKP